MSTGWTLKEQTLNISVDVAQQCIKGFTELTVAPAPGASAPATLSLHARQMAVSAVRVNGGAASFRFETHLDRLVPPEQAVLRDLGTLAAYRTKAWAESQAGGELHVTLPPGMVYSARIQVDYVLNEPQGGAWFRWPRGDEKAPHMYTAGRYGEASSWFPCFNRPSARCPFVLTVTTDRELTVVASGAADPFPEELEDGVTLRRTFRTASHCSARDVFLAVGFFHSHVNPKCPTVTHYCMPGKQADLEQTMAQFGDAFAFMENQVGSSCPVASFSTLFLPEMAAANSGSYHGCAVFCDSVLFNKSMIDEEAEGVFAVTCALAEQWVQHFVRVDEWCEVWIQIGLSQLVAYMYMKTFEFENNSLWRLMQLTEEFLDMPLDQVARPMRLSEPGHAWDMFMPLVQVKSLIVLAMVQRRVGDGQFQEVLRALFSEPAVYDSHSFLEKIANTARHTMDDIEQFWVQRGGFPTIRCGFSWNPKRHYLEFALKQDFSNFRFHGLLPVQVQEVEGTFNHEIMFTDEKPYAWDDFPIHARPTVKKKKRAKKNADGTPATADAAGNTGETGATGTPAVTPAAGGPTDKAAGAASTPGTDDKEMCPIMFLRVDPERHWIMKVTFQQPEEMWMNQLDAERNILSEREAVKALCLCRTMSSVDRLGEVLNDPDRYVHIRCEAARSLSILAGPDTEWKAAQTLVGYYREMHYKDGVLEPNSFGDFAKYYLARAVIDALANIRQDGGLSWPGAVTLVIDLLKNNENALNPYSDHMFVRTLLLAAGRMRAQPQQQQLLDAQIQRYARLGDTLPSPGATLQQSVLEARMTRVLGGGASESAPELEAFRKALMLQGLPSSVRAVAGHGYLSVTLVAGEEFALSALERILSLIESPSESPALRLALLEKCMAAIRSRNHQLALANRGRVFCTPASAGLLNRVWALCEGPVFAHCEILRAASSALFQAIWGLQWPTDVMGPAPEGILIASRAIATEAPTLAQSRRAHQQQELGWRGAISSSSSTATTPAAEKLSLKISIPKTADKPSAAAAEPEPKKVKTESAEEQRKEVEKGAQ